MNYLQCSGQKNVPPVRQRGLLKQQWTLENYSSYSFSNTLPTCPKSKTPESARTPPMRLLAPEYLIVSTCSPVRPSSPPSGWQSESHRQWLTGTRDSSLGSVFEVVILPWGAVATLEALRTCLGLKCPFRRTVLPFNCVSNVLIDHCSAISRGFYLLMPSVIMTGSGLNFTLLFVWEFQLYTLCTDILGRIPLLSLEEVCRWSSPDSWIFVELVKKQRTMEVPVPRLARMLKIVATASRMKDAIFGHKLAYS